MAHKTFISYKYSEAQGLRDDIITALGKDANYYKVTILFSATTILSAVFQPIK